MIFNYLGKEAKSNTKCQINTIAKATRTSSSIILKGLHSWVQATMTGFGKVQSSN